MSHSPFPWMPYTQSSTAVFDANGLKFAATEGGHVFPEIDPETAEDNAALIAAIPAMITLLSEMALHFEMASSGFIGGCKSDQVWREKQDELIAEARVLASIGKKP